MAVSSLILAGAIATGGNLHFDFECRGTEAVFFQETRQWARQPFLERIHVDLERGLFCSDACTALRHVHRVTPAEYALLDASDGARHWEKKVIQRDPATRSLSYVWRYKGQNIERHGVCSITTFSAFPAEARVEQHLNDPTQTWSPPS